MLLIDVNINISILKITKNPITPFVAICHYLLLVHNPLEYRETNSIEYVNYTTAKKSLKYT